MRGHQSFGTCSGYPMGATDYIDFSKCPSREEVSVRHAILRELRASGEWDGASWTAPDIDEIVKARMSELSELITA